MTRPVRPGIYEDLLTAALEAGINARTTEGWRVQWPRYPLQRPPREYDAVLTELAP